MKTDYPVIFVKTIEPNLKFENCFSTFDSQYHCWWNLCASFGLDVNESCLHVYSGGRINYVNECTLKGERIGAGAEIQEAGATGSPPW